MIAQQELDDAEAKSPASELAEEDGRSAALPVLKLAEPVAYQAPLAEWPLPSAPPFVGSRELDWLTADLRRYVRGQVRGRSYLIAGHRGAGKTALAVRAVEQLATELLRESVKETAVDLANGALQRPLLVKLHGPSMLEQAGPAPVPKAQQPIDAGQVPDVEGGKPVKEAPEPEPGADPVTPGVHAALVQITIGLYRALAAEAATGFRAHARLQQASPPGDKNELAAQLALELDSGATPAMLRHFWSSLGRLKLGVFWPKTADKTCAALGMTDQGLREVMALATAAQAFQVCTGRISYTTKVTDSIVRTLTSELKGASDLKDVIGRLGTLGIGALTGVSLMGATGPGPIAAVATGVAVWLIGSLSLSWSRKTVRTDNRSIDYSFIRDFTLSTLERDLPVVITRAREAGLAPVFVIDELDKVPNASDALADLVGRLKHLIADFGFFCFLVNRDCYEAMDRRVRKKAYPAEHTLFSERLLLRPDPPYALAYLLGLVTIDVNDPQSVLARSTFALRVMHEARLNLTDMMRILARRPQDDARMIGTAAGLTQQRDLVLATVQIAIDETLRSEALASRAQADSGFAQLAIDTLYDPSRTWSSGALEVDPKHDALAARLEQRMRADASALPAGAGVKDADEVKIEPADLELLQAHLVRFLDLLSDLRALRDRLGERNAGGSVGDPQAGDIRLADIPPSDVAQICEKLDDGRYRFLFDRDGRPAGTEAGRLTAEQRRRAQELIDFADAFEALLSDVGISFDDLARTPLLRSISGSVVALARRELSAALRRGALDPDIVQHLSTMERLHGEVEREREKLGELFLIVASIRRDVEEPRPILPAISRLIRFERSPERWISGRSARPPHAIPGNAEGLRKWQEDYRVRLLPAPGLPPGTEPFHFDALVEPLERYFEKPARGDLSPVPYGMLMQAADGKLPAAALSARLGSMTARDWSALALAAVPRRQAPPAAPFWMLVIGLRGLGFGRDALTELADPELESDLKATGWLLGTATMSAQQGFDIIGRLAAKAPERPRGIVVIEHRTRSYGDDRPSKRRPTLFVDQRDLADYLPALRWLEALDILAGQALVDPDEGEAIT